MAKRLLKQQQKDKNKLYSLHAPEVECINKVNSSDRLVSDLKINWPCNSTGCTLTGGAHCLTCGELEVSTTR